MMLAASYVLGGRASEMFAYNDGKKKSPRLRSDEGRRLFPLWYGTAAIVGSVGVR